MSAKLLIADDEDVVRNGIDKYIRLHTDRFKQIYLAKNGQEAVDIIFRMQPDIMLLDVQMPIKNGIEVMTETKKAKILPATIILSGYDAFKYVQQALRLGAKDYFLKPTRSSEILEKINELADEIYGPVNENAADSEMDTSDWVQLTKEYVKEHYFENLTLTEVAAKIGISNCYLSTLFSKEMNQTFIDYLNQIRIAHACTYLQQNYLKTYEIAYKVGYRDEKYFSKVFRKIMNVSPKEYKRDKMRMDI